MENLSDRSEILGLERIVNGAKIFGMAKLIAQLQFRVQQQEEHRSWWIGLERNLHIDTFYTSWMPAGCRFQASNGDIRLFSVCSLKF